MGLGELPSHLVNERLRAAAKQARVFGKESPAWRQAVSRALRGIGAKSGKSRSPSGQVTWVWTMDKQPQNQDQPPSSTQ